jgi:hypothetical protein
MIKQRITKMYKEGSVSVYYEIRDATGLVIKAGETGGKEAWIKHKKFGKQNTMKRVKSALKLKWSTKTTKRPKTGSEDICRAFDDGSTIHIWIGRSMGPSVEELDAALDGL